MGVDCGNGPCRVECTAPLEACVAVNLGAMSASSLCLECRGQLGNPGCKATDGTKPKAGKPCNVSCGGGGCNANGNGLNSCPDLNTAHCP